MLSARIGLQDLSHPCPMQTNLSPDFPISHSFCKKCKDTFPERVFVGIQMIDEGGMEQRNIKGKCMHSSWDVAPPLKDSGWRMGDYISAFVQVLQ